MGQTGYTGSKGDTGPAGTGGGGTPGLLPYLDGAPDSPGLGQAYVDAGTFELKIFTLNGWITIGSPNP